MSVLSGQVEIRVLDADTLEVLDVVKQNNVITRKCYHNFLNGVVPNKEIYISPSTAPSYEDWCSVANCITDGFTPAGVTTPLDVPASGPTPRYVQLMRRFNAPATTRSISTILLPYGQGDSFSQQIAFAYVSLTVPCVQTNTQILDVYYRVQAVETTTYMYNNSPTNAARTLFTVMGVFGYAVNSYVLPVVATIMPVYSNVPSASNTNPTAIGKMCPVFASSKAITRGTTSVYTDTAYPTQTFSWSYSTSQGVGDIHGSMAVMAGTWPNEAYTVTNLTAPNKSKIQPIFSHSSTTRALTTANPFLDSTPGSGTGSVIFSGTWNAGLMPELYKVDIVTSGAVGTATYTFSKRNHFGFRGTTYCSDVNSLAGLYYIANTASKKHTGVSAADNTSVGGYGNRLERYDETRIITHDSTGVTRYNCATQAIEQWDSTSTPQLSATNIRQVAVNPGDGSIWVACANTGIYKINADGTSITRFTTANGLFSNNVYALDIGRNNAIWAVCQGAMITSADGGVTWAYYNASTTPSFTCIAIDNEYNSVNYIRVDPTHVDDRICIVRKDNATSMTTTGYLWWSRGTGVVVYGTTNTFGTEGGYTFRRNISSFNVSDNDGIWLVTGSEYNYGNAPLGYMYKLTYGTASVQSVALPSSYTLVQSTMFVRDSTNTQDLILIVGNGVEGFQTNNAVINGNAESKGMHHVYLYNSALSLVAHAAPPALSTVSTALINQYSNLVYLGNGVIAGLSNVGSYYVPYEQGSAGVIFAISGDGTPSGGPLEYLVWQKYGWDGTQWVLGNTTAKTTHSGVQPMLHGISINFTDGGSGTSFITDDYYTGSVNDGVLKNNAMTLAGSYTYYALPSQKLTDFDGVVRLYPWTTGLVTWRKVAASLTINGDKSITNNIPYRSYGMSAGSKNRVFGDFSITGSFSTNVNQRYQIGIRAYNKSDYPTIRQDSYNDWSFSLNGNTLTIKNSSDTQLWTSTLGGTTSWNITRVGNTLTFYTGGVSRYVTVDTTYSFIVNARFTDTTTGTNAFTVNPVTIDSSGTGYYVGLGNGGTATGIYDPKQLLTYIFSGADILLDGVALTTLAVVGAPPAPGGAVLAPEEGLLFFNSADSGKTVTGNYLMSYQVSTPCNIPPV